MDDTPSPSTDSYLLTRLFAFKHIEVIDLAVGAPSTEAARTECCVLLAVSGGGFTLRVNGSELRIGPDCCVVAPPGASIRIEPPEAGDACRARVYLAAFGAQPVAGAEAGEGFPFFGETSIRQKRRFAGLLQSLYRHRQSGDELQRFRNQLHLQELLLLIGESRLSRRVGADSAKAVERSIERLRANCPERVAVSELAREANMSRRQYTKLFREQTGRSPVEYVNGLRIRRAQELLLTSAGKIRDISRDAGFRDEYYFSRRFKLIVGTAPGSYVRELQREPRVVSLHYTGELLACGIVPVGVPDMCKRHFPEALGQAASIGEYPWYDRRKIAALRPNLILAPPYLGPGEIAELSAIAPTVAPPWWESDALGHLRYIGDLLGRREEAEAWIARYALKTEQTRSLLRPRLQRERTAAIFQLTGSRFLVYGARNIGHTIYRSLGYAPPAPLKLRIEADARFNFADLPVGALKELAAERIFMLVGQTSDALMRWREMERSSLWQSLPAVAEGKITYMGEKWVSYDPVTLDWQLDDIARKLGNQNGFDIHLKEGELSFERDPGVSKEVKVFPS